MGFWASYNCPFFPEIRKLSGYADMASHPDVGFFFDYAQTPRAEILRRDQAAVDGVPAMQRVMRAADYTREPFARNCSRYVVAARYELAPEHCPWWSPISGADLAEGAVGAGTTAVSGPPHGGAVPIFRWARFPEIAHELQPDAFDFDWETFAPQAPAQILV